MERYQLYALLKGTGDPVKGRCTGMEFPLSLG